MWRGEPRGGAVLQRVRSSPRRGGPSGGAARRLGALRRPRRLHLSLRAARPRGRPGVSHAVLRERPCGDRAPRRDGREVHRRRGDGPLRGADRVRRRSGAGGARRPRRARLGGGRGPPGPRRGQHRRGARRPRRGRGPRRAAGRGRRGQYRGPAPGRCPGRLGRRRRRDARGDADVDRLPTGPTGRRQGKVGADPGLAGRRATDRSGRARAHPRPDRRSRARAGDARRDLGACDRRATSAARDDRRALRHREVTSRPRVLEPRVVARRESTSRTLHSVRRERAVRGVRPSREADRARVRQRRPRGGEREAPHDARRPRRLGGGGRRARPAPRATARARRRRDGERPRDALLLRPRAPRDRGEPRADRAPLRGHPLGRSEPARPPRDPRRATARRSRSSCSPSPDRSS